jgi:hypothetical protein
LCFKLLDIFKFKFKGKNARLDNFYKPANKSIIIRLFDEYYSLLVERSNKIGGVRKTVGIWMDINPVEISILSKKRKLEDARIVLDVIETGCLDLQVKLEREDFQDEEYKIISSHVRDIQFKCQKFQMMLSVQDCLSFRTVKEIILWKAGINNCWIKFMLSETLFTDNCKMF